MGNRHGQGKPVDEINARNSAGNVKVEMLGRRFGLLRVTAYAGRKNGRSLWHCICDCGRETDVPESSLKNGNTTSCGCKSKATDYLHFVDGTFIEAIQTRTVAKNNTSGVRGVYWDSRKHRWVARIKFQKKNALSGQLPHTGGSQKSPRPGGGSPVRYLPAAVLCRRKAGNQHPRGERVKQRMQWLA